MRLDGFTEISAVCVGPAYRGHGFAAERVRSLASSIAARSEIPILHVFSSNHAAIGLYRKLGFTLRRRVHLAVLMQAVARRVPDIPDSSKSKEATMSSDAVLRDRARRQGDQTRGCRK
jgi:ribosomal protein S18 acetylase RimI-like enzyme